MMTIGGGHDPLLPSRPQTHYAKVIIQYTTIDVTEANNDS
jgi:hypothetical protein